MPTGMRLQWVRVLMLPMRLPEVPTMTSNDSSVFLPSFLQRLADPSIKTVMMPWPSDLGSPIGSLSVGQLPSAMRHLVPDAGV